MKRNFIRGLLICLLPCLAAGYYALRGNYRLGIDLAGGTILVYEINLERTNLRKQIQGDGPSRSAGQGLSSEEMNQLAAQIKRRIDPADLKNVTVRPLGDTRVEIILPTGGASTRGRTNLNTSEIDEVKGLISQMGVLEFRILANENDDGPGIDAVRQRLASIPPDEMDARSARGLPPETVGEDFDVRINEESARVRYAWVELSPEERESLHLTNAEETIKSPEYPLWSRLQGARNKVIVHADSAGEQNKRGSYTMVLFSRECKSTVQLEKEKTAREMLEKEGKLDTFNPKKVEYFLLTRISPLDQVRIGGDVSLSAKADQDQNQNLCIGFSLGGAGVQQFSKMTDRNKPSGPSASLIYRHLAIVLDEKIISAPTLNSQLRGGGIISQPKGMKKPYVDQIVGLLKSGALSAELRDKPVSENTIGPTLGADTIKRGTLAIGVAFVAVLGFMLVYYRFAGFVACVALLANLLLTIGFMVAVNAAFTLPGLAGVVLMLGMAVDANVLIYERIREERNKGANLVTAIRNGYERAFPTIIDTHLSSIFTAIVLYTLGNDNLKGFSISLTVGLIISLFTSLYMTRLLFDFWIAKKWLTNLRMMRLFERPTYNPMKYRFYLFSATTALTILGLGLFLVRGDDVLNVDFRGGTVYAGRLKDGEERAMGKVGDKPGFRDMLDPTNQEKLLGISRVRWTNPIDGDIASANSYDFEITYADGKTATVTLTQKPAGTTQAEMEAEVKARAGRLPDVSVEQMFLTGEAYPDGKSRYFTIRTTEKQRELVQASLDRLLRDGNKGLVEGASIAYPAIDAATATVVLTFDKPTSPGYMKELLGREFRKAGASDAATAFGLTPSKDEGTGVDGKYKSMTLDVSKSSDYELLKPGATGDAGLKDNQRKSLAKVLADTKQAFESSPEPERLEVFDSQLASDTRSKAFYAIVASWIAVMLYLWFRFGNWTFGAAAVLCLIHDLCFTLGCIAACHYVANSIFGPILRVEDFKIDLASVAALLTLVGYSVNDTIVVFDRIREVRGKHPNLTAQMINDSVNQTLSRTVLASLTVFLVVGVLYIFGGEGVHLFSFVMVVGVVVGTYSSVFVAAPLLLIFGEGHVEDVPELTEATSREREVVEA